MRRRQVVICGGGIAGASMASALADSDLSVIILEKDEESQLGRSSGGEALRSETCRAFDRLGLLRYIQQFSHVSRLGERRELYHVDLGMLGAFRYDYLAPEYPVIHILHNYIVRGIYRFLENSPNVEQVFGAEVVGVGDYRDERRRVLYKMRRDGSERAVEADLVVVADGTNSPIRRSLNIPTEEHDYGIVYLMFYVSKIAELEWGRFYVGPHGFIGVFPTSEDMLRIAVEVRLRDLRWWLSAREEEIRERIVKKAPILDRCVILRRGLPFHVVRRHAEYYVLDGLCVIGDAAHTTSPMLAQGIALALNDVLSLRDVLSRHAEGPFRREVLMKFEDNARPYNSTVIENNHRLYYWIQDMCGDASFIRKIMDSLEAMGFEPVHRSS